MEIDNKKQTRCGIIENFCVVFGVRAWSFMSVKTLSASSSIACIPIILKGVYQNIHFDHPLFLMYSPVCYSTKAMTSPLATMSPCLEQMATMRPLTAGMTSSIP